MINQHYKRLAINALNDMKSEAMQIDILINEIELADDSKTDYDEILTEIEKVTDKITSARHLAFKDCRNRNCGNIISPRLGLA